MTAVTVTTTVPLKGKIEDNSASYESTSAHIIEETEYVKKIRTTLEKIRNQIFKDEVRHNSTNHKQDAKHCGHIQNGFDSELDPSCCSLDLLMERIKGKDLQLLEMNKENEVLKIKLEASREAGAAALRNVAQRLFENYQTQSKEVRQKHEDSRHLLQVNTLEKEQKLKQHVENLNQIAEKLEEKHNQITELENLVQRMEKEKRTLLEKKLSLENKLLHLKSKATYAKSCQDLQKEIFLLQEQISHLQFVIHSQHQNLRSVIQEMEGLKNNLKEQDKRIEDLKEKVNILEAQLITDCLDLVTFSASSLSIVTSLCVTLSCPVEYRDALSSLKPALLLELFSSPGQTREELHDRIPSTRLTILSTTTFLLLSSNRRKKS